MKMVRQGANSYTFSFDTGEPVVSYRKSLKGYKVEIVSELSFKVHANPLQFPHILRLLRGVAQDEGGMSKPAAVAHIQERLHAAIGDRPGQDIDQFIYRVPYEEN